MYEDDDEEMLKKIGCWWCTIRYTYLKLILMNWCRLDKLNQTWFWMCND